MAISASFKQKCPCCDALVPIKDSNQIGKKIDCPTCKHKFTVVDPAEVDKETVKGANKGGKKKTAVNGAKDKETPAGKSKSKLSKALGKARPAADDDDELDDEEEERRKPAKNKKKKIVRDEEDDEGDDDEEEEKGRKKKKDSGTNKFTLGVALAAVGVVVLGVAAYFIMAGRSSSPTSSPGSGPIAQTPGGPPSETPQQPGNAKDKPGTTPATTPRQPLQAAGSELTNLLPNDSEHVFHVFFKDLLDEQSPLRKAAFDTPGAFVDEEMRKRLGFSPLAIDDLIRAEKYTGSPWAFTVIHCLEQINLDDLTKALDLKPAKESPIKRQDFFEAKGNPWLDQFGRLAFGVPLGQRSLLPKREGRPLYVRLHNKQTVILADKEPLVAFLQAEGQFKYLTQPTAPPAVPAYQPGTPMGPPGTMPMGPPGTMPMGPGYPMGPGAPMVPGGPPPMPQGGPDPMAPMVPGGPPPMPQGGPGPMAPPGGAGPGSPGYPPGYMNPGDPGAMPGQQPPAMPPAAAARYEAFLTINPKLKAMLERMETIGDAKDKVLFSSATDLRAARVDSKAAPFKDRLYWYFRPVWDVTYLLEEKSPRLQILGATLHMMNKDRTFQYRNELDCGKGKEPEAKALQKDLQEKAAPQVVKFMERFFGHKVELAKVETPQATFPEGVMPPDGSGYPMPYMPPRGLPTPMPMAPGYPPPMGPGGYMPPGADPNQIPMEKKDEPENSRILISQKEAVVTFTLDLLLDQVAYARVYSLAEMLMCGLKGEMDLVLGSSAKHQLAKAALKMAETGLSERQILPGAYPPGAFKRPASGLRTAREPNQRVSWMAGLLPFLGQDNLYSKIYSKIQFDESWKDPANWLVARTLVPQFLDPTYPDSSRFVTYSDRGLEAATTHFVGIAGVGLDAAEYPANDPAYQHKRGVFGYDQSLRLQDVKAGRGMSNTILMIQVPHDGPAGVTPWLAGGGATVRGVPDKNSIAPFVLGLGRDGKPITHEGKRGTYALMTDGSVRFIDKNISDDAFKAMCTVKGPAPEGFNPTKDKNTPLVEEPKAPEPPKEVGAKTQTPKTPTKKGSTPEKTQPSKAPLGWQEYVSKEGGFAVTMPSNFKTMPQPAPGIGTIPMTMALDVAKKHVFITAFFNPPQAPAVAGDKEFADIRQGLLGQLAGKASLRRETPISLGKHPGREYELDAGKGLTSLVRIYIVGGRVYMLNATVSVTDAASPEVQRFFNSFRLTQ